MKSGWWGKSNGGGIKFRRASNDSRLDFKPPEEFHQLVKENNDDAIKYFTIEGDTFYYADKSYVVTDGKTTSTTINERSGNYKTMASGYGVPYEFFVNLTAHTGQLDFALKLADYVIDNSGLTITIMDTTTTTTTTTTVNYDWSYKGYKTYTFSGHAASGDGSNKTDEWTDTWLEGINQDVDNSANGYNVLSGEIYNYSDAPNLNREVLKDKYKNLVGEKDDFFEAAFSENSTIGVEEIARVMVEKIGKREKFSVPARVDKGVEHGTEQHTVTHYDTSSYTKVTKVESWIGDIKTEYKLQDNEPTLTYGDAGEDSTLENSEWEDVEDNDETDNSKDYIKKQKEKYVAQYNVFKERADVDYDLNTTEGHVQRQKTNTVQNVYEEVATQTYNMEPEKVENADEKVEGIVDLLRKKYKDTFTGIKSVAGDLLVDSAEMWFSELEHNESTKNLANVMRYILYKYSGNDYGVKDLNSLLQSLYSTMSDFSFVSIPVDFRSLTEEQEKYHITDLETLKKAFASYPTSKNLLAHAQEFLDFQEKYKVNALFAAVVSIQETTAGTAGHAVDGLDNWFNIKNKDGNYIDYSSASDSIKGFYDLIANGKSYFQAGNNTINSIGHIYCPNDPPAHPTQGDDWVKFVTSHMMEMYSEIGIVVTPSGNAGQFLEIAKNCHDYVATEKYTYSQGRNIPIVKGEKNKTIDCSAYVSWALYEFGYSEFAGWQHTTGNLESALQKCGWQKITNEGELQAGDIVFVDAHGGNNLNHVQIFAGYSGNGQQTWLNCGSTKAIQKVQPGEYNLKSANMNFLFAYRIPSQE